MSTRWMLAAAFTLALEMPAAHAADRGTADEAVAMTKKAVEMIKSDGADKILAAITAKDAPFVDRDLYVVAYDMQGKCLAHGANKKLVGKDLMENQDTDGVYYIKDRIEMAKTKPTFWQDYKFTDPVSKKIEPKKTYCERAAEMVICVGFYKP